MVHLYSNTSGRKLIKVGNKVVGYLEGNHFIKWVMGSKHRLRCPPAWAIDADAFNTDIRPNATEIIVIDKEAGLKYRCPVETFDRLKGVLDRGFGRQYFLPISNWKVTEPNGPRQLSLWGDEGHA